MKCISSLTCLLLFIRIFIHSNFKCFRGGVAQRIEQRFSKPLVVGSSPATPTIRAFPLIVLDASIYLADSGLSLAVFVVLVTNDALPMIRYRTRDLTRLLPGTARKSMRRMDKIKGRSDDMLIIRGVNVFPSQIEEQICSIEGLSSHYLIEVDKLGNMDRMKVRVEGDSNRDKLNPEQLIKSLGHKIKTFIGISAHIEIVQANQLPRSEGKAQRVMDHRYKSLNKPTV